MENGGGASLLTAVIGEETWERTSVLLGARHGFRPSASGALDDPLELREDGRVADRVRNHQHCGASPGTEGGPRALRSTAKLHVGLGRRLQTSPPSGPAERAQRPPATVSPGSAALLRQSPAVQARSGARFPGRHPRPSEGVGIVVRPQVTPCSSALDSLLYGVTVQMLTRNIH